MFTRSISFLFFLAFIGFVHAQSFDQKTMELLDDNAIKKAQKRLDRIGTEMPALDHQFLQGKIHRKSGAYTEALEIFYDILTSDSLYAFAYDEIGVVKAIQGESYQTCLTYYAKALEILPEEPTFLGHMGTGYYLGANYDMALKYYKKVLEIEPNNEYMLYNAGLVYTNQDDDINAVLLFTKALKIRKDAKTYFDRGKSHYFLEMYSLALKDFRRTKRKMTNENAYEAIDSSLLKDYMDSSKKLKKRK